jgi:hypothetical protein
MPVMAHSKCYLMTAVSVGWPGCGQQYCNTLLTLHCGTWSNSMMKHRIHALRSGLIWWNTPAHHYRCNKQLTSTVRTPTNLDRATRSTDSDQPITIRLISSGGRDQSISVEYFGDVRKSTDIALWIFVDFIKFLSYIMALGSEIFPLP